MTIVRLSVTEFAEKSLLTGDIDERALLMQVDPELGVEIHQIIQARLTSELPGYRSESKLDHTFGMDEILFEISGRIDGMWLDHGGDQPMMVIDEIKSTWSIARLKKNLELDSEHPYLMQTRLYGWIFSQKDDRPFSLQLRLVSAADRAEEIVPVSFDKELFAAWFDRRKEHLYKLWQESMAWKERAKTESKKFKFPYTVTRSGQESLRTDVEAVCKSKKNLLAQAPTGIGKTAGIMFPALANAMGRGDKLIYVTPKNSQQREAESFVRKLHKRKRDVKSLTLTSKSKICMLDTEPTCRPDLCRFANAHYDKVNEHKILEQLKTKRIIDRTALQALAKEYEVCPWELARQISPWVDVIIGDYHYGLAPQGHMVDIAVRPFDDKAKPILAIDEAHNLAERSLDWYSIILSDIPENLIKSVKKPLRKALYGINTWFDRHRPIRNQVTRSFHHQELANLMEQWSKHMPQVIVALYQKENGDTSAEHTESASLIQLWFEWLGAMELLTSGQDVFFAMATADLPVAKLHLHCGNAGPFLAESFKKFRSILAFSATLKPFHYHLAMWGQTDPHAVDQREWLSKEYPSPFGADNRCIIAIPQISTRYRERSRQIPRIAEVIHRVTSERHGNYIVFFPSFELLGQVATIWQGSEYAQGLPLLQQPRMAKPSWVQQVLGHLESTQGTLVFAVQGGVLSEGIDLPHEQLIGAIIVGPALPTVSPEREEMRRMFAARGEDGFAMAYIHPAMAKSVQSAGRVIRTETDRGVIVLLDDRFLDPTYTASLPEDWLPPSHEIRDLVPKSIITRLKEFWKDTASSEKEQTH